MPLRDYLPDIALPPFLDGGQGLLQAWGEQLDQLAQRARDTAQAALLDLCDPSFLGHHGANSNLDTAKGETPGAFRTYLQGRFSRWRDSGTEPQLQLELARLGYSRCRVISWLDLALAGNPGAFGGFSSFWYLQINKPNPFGPPGKWNAGDKWNAAPYLWGISGITSAEINNLIRVVRKWGPGGGSCRFIELVIAANIFGAPTKVLRIPCYEEWQRTSTGAFTDFYNFTY